MEPAADASGISDGSLQLLSTKRVFFGHMSVGWNILQGIEDLKQTDGRLSVIHIREVQPGDAITGPGIYHYQLGDNFFPLKKIGSCSAILGPVVEGQMFDIIAMKFCYLDIGENTDVPALFDAYQGFVKDIKSLHPEARVVHVTVPLTVHFRGVKGFVRMLIKGDRANAKRSRFNKLLVQRYQGEDHIFDLARIESTKPDGTRSSYNHKGEEAYTLVGAYTYDGGHLNEAGRRRAAAEFVRVLAGAAGAPSEGGNGEDL